MSYEKQTWASGDTISGAKLNHIEEGVEGINMSYEKTTWQSGDTITAEKLNNIEDGIAGAGDFTMATVTFDLTPPVGVTFVEINSQTAIAYPTDGSDYYNSYGTSGVTEREILLYQGEATIKITEVYDANYANYIYDGAPTVTGDATVEEDDGEYYFTVTGDCTIHATMKEHGIG